MRFIAKDTLTGETREIDEPDATVFWLADGNGDCDSNRAKLWFDIDEDDFPEGCCCRFGEGDTHRFVVVEVLDWRNEHPEDLAYVNS